MTDPKRLRAVKDRRSTWSRRHRQLACAFAADLGTDLSAADRAFVDHAATVALECEKMKTSQLNGVVIDPNELVRLSNALTRIRKEMGARVAANKPDLRTMTFDERMKARDERIKAEEAARNAEGNEDDDFDF